MTIEDTEKSFQLDGIEKGIRTLWPSLTDIQETLLLSRMVVRQFNKQEVIYSARSMPHYILVVLRGKVKVFKDGIGGRNQIIRVVKPVELFGARAYFAGELHSSTATTLEPSVIAFIPSEVMMEVIRANSEVSISFIRHLAIHLGHSDTRTVTLTQKHIRARLAETLLFLKSQYGMESDGQTLNIYLSREDLGSLSNMTTSNAIRTLASLAEDGAVAIEGKKIKILQEDALQAISQEKLLK